MTTYDTFPKTSPLAAVTPPLLTALLLLLLLGIPALMAPSDAPATLDWHGNAATTTR